MRRQTSGQGEKGGARRCPRARWLSQQIPPRAMPRCPPPRRWQLGRSQEQARTRSVRTSRASPPAAHPGRRGHSHASDGKALLWGHGATQSALASNAGLPAPESAFPVTQSLGSRTVPWLCIGWPVAIRCAAGSVPSGCTAPHCGLWAGRPVLSPRQAIV